MTTEGAGETPPGPVRVGAWALLRVLLRSFMVQSANNYERMQGPGFGYCMMPALRRLYAGERLAGAVARHLEFYNSHPYFSPAVLGAVIRLEEQVAAGESEPDRVRRYKQVAMGPLAAIGDRFFWTSLKPFAAAWAVAGVLSGITWAPLAFLGLYNLFHLFVRVYGLASGYRQGEKVILQLNRLELPRLSNRTHYFTGAFVGVAAALIVDAAALSPLALGDGLEPVLVLILVLIFFLSLKRKIGMPALLYGSTLVIAGVMMVLNALFPVV